MASNPKNMAPPKFNEDVDTWEDYKKEIEMWKFCTNLELRKQGPAFYILLKGKAKELVKNIPNAEITADDGLNRMLTELDKLYEKDKSQNQYLTYKSFLEFSRSDGMSMRDYIAKFEVLSAKIKAKGFDMPDSALAYHLLDFAKLDEESMKLTKATLTELNYNQMKEQLLKIFGDEVVATSSSSGEPSGFEDVKVKVEPVFYGYGRNNNYRRGSNRGGRGRGRFSRQRGRGQQKTENPPSRCSICNSKFHWAKSCPDSYYQQEHHDVGYMANVAGDYEEEEVILLQTKNYKKEILGTLVKETLGCAVVDSGCSKTVVGKQWLQCFEDTVNQKFDMKESKQKFKFGKGDAVESLGKIKIPLCLGTRNVSLVTDVVNVNIPLLLSKESMKKASTVLDFKKDTAEMFGEKHKLISTSSGHYALPIVLSRKEDCIAEHIALLNDHFSEKPDYHKIALKLHKQFCHCTADKLKKFVEKSKLWKGDKQLLKLIDDVSDSCRLCKVYKKNPPTPIVALPLASDFNEVVAMDLITIKQGLWIVHLIDMFSRYSVAASTTSKKSSVISDTIMKSWFAYFGTPKKFIADNGGEFSGEEYSDMCEMFDIEMLKTAAESPWSNGLCERHNGVIKESVKKTLEDSGCSLETATSWATSAKNTLLGHQGFSPNILVFGRNPNYPSVLVNKPPALCNDQISVTVEKNLRAMHSARKAFVEAESSEKIKRALRHNIRKCNDIILQNGDRVYYKRNDSQRWHGPGIVIGQHNKQVLVKVGSRSISVHTSRVMRTDNVCYDKMKINNSKQDDAPVKQRTGTGNGNDKFPDSLLQHYKLYDEDDEDDDSEREEDVNEDDDDDDDGGNDDNLVDNDHHEDVQPPADNMENPDEDNDDRPQEEFIDDADILISDAEGVVEEENIINGIDDEININILPEHVESQTDEEEFHDAAETYAEVPADDVEQFDTTVIEVDNDSDQIEEIVYPKVKSSILYKLGDSGRWLEGVVHSRAGKVKGRNKGFFNIQDPITGLCECYNFDSDIVQWEPVPSQTLITDMDKESILVAKRKELENWKNKDVYVEVPHTEQSVITSRWVITTKTVQGSMVTRARLVARGFEDQGLEDRRTDSPTICKESIRILLALISTKGWVCNTMDVETAFLQGNALTRDVFLKPPKEANTTNIWKLNKSVYGLNEASKHWYERADHELTSVGMRKSKYDEALYYCHHKGKCHGIIGLHVDDFMHGGTNYLQQSVINKFREAIIIGSEEVSPLKYLGMSIYQEKSEITVNQQLYLDDIEKYSVNEKEKRRMLNQDEQHMYRSIVGQLNWLATQSRPDIAFDVCKLSSKLTEPTVQDVMDANKTLKKANSNKVQLRYKKLKPPLQLIAYCDASYANLPDGGSQGGYVVFLTDNENNASPLAWRSRKLRRVCRSTLTAETMSLVDTIDVCVWMKHVIDEIDDMELLTTIIRTDNRDLYNAAHSTKAVEEKRLRVELGSIRESIRNDEIVIEWVPGDEQIADSLTKQGANVNKLINVLNEGSLHYVKN